MSFYLVVEDFIRASVGPFASAEEADDHFKWSVEVRGDSGSKIGVFEADEHPESMLQLTPEADKAFI